MTMRRPKRSKRGNQRQPASDHRAGAGKGSEGERDNDDYTVGYGRPPEEHRFKEGVSGNPHGRPKRKFDPKGAVRRALARTMKVKVNGIVKTMTGVEAMIEVQLQKALTGDLRAAQLLLRLEHEFGQAADQLVDAEVLTEEQQSIIDDLVRRVADDDKPDRLPSKGKAIRRSGR